MNLKSKIETYKEDVIKTLQELVQIKSVEGEPYPRKPFGDGPYNALQYVLNKGKEMGFETLDVDGYAGHIEYGEGDEIIAVLTHLDVVPEGEDWRYPSYGGEIHDGKIYGRGTIDDKGPAVASLYALKAIKDEQLSLNRRIRLIFGTNEETARKGIEYYFSKLPQPDLGFSPDGYFPVIYGEKGILMFELVSQSYDEVDSDIKLLFVKGGERSNMVPDRCEARLEVSSEKKELVMEKIDCFIDRNTYKLSYEWRDNILNIKASGLAAHGSNPNLGLNAVSVMMKLLENLDLSGQIGSWIEFYNQYIGFETNGESIGCGLRDDVSGALIFNIGILEMNSQNIKITVNVRYPISCTDNEVFEGMTKILDCYGFKIIKHDHAKPLFLSKDSTLIKTLLGVYSEITEDYKREPLVIGGGTYSRMMRNTVAFGPIFPGQSDLTHQSNENISIEDLMKITLIYAEAMYRLAK